VFGCTEEKEKDRKFYKEIECKNIPLITNLLGKAKGAMRGIKYKK